MSTTTNRASRRGSAGKSTRRAGIVLSSAFTTLAVAALAAAPAQAVTISPTAPPGVGTFQTVLNWLGWAISIAGVVGIMGVGILMAVSHRRGESGEHMGKLGAVLGGLILATAAGPIVNALT